jgi:hypothetical protein
MPVPESLTAERACALAEISANCGKFRAVISRSRIDEIRVVQLTSLINSALPSYDILEQVAPQRNMLPLGVRADCDTAPLVNDAASTIAARLAPGLP